MQAEFPATNFVAERWEDLVGADIADDDGSLLAAWVGWTPGEPRATRSGLSVHVHSERWIDEVSLTRAFAGARPFGIDHVIEIASLTARLGPAAVSDGKRALWRLMPPTGAPLELEVVEPSSAKGEDERLLVLRRNVQQLEAWLALTTRMGSPSPELVKDVATAAEMRRPPRYLEPFVSPFDAVVGSGWSHRRVEAEGTLPTRVEWRLDNGDPFGRDPLLKLSAQPEQGGFDLMLEIRLPLE